MKLDPSGAATGLAPVPTPDPALRGLHTIENAIQAIEEQRVDLVDVYRTARGGTDAEFELGECIQHVRKALVRLRKARGLLAQIGLPLE